jgi:hypothetical protein
VAARLRRRRGGGLRRRRGEYVTGSPAGRPDDDARARAGATSQDTTADRVWRAGTDRLPKILSGFAETDTGRPGSAASRSGHDGAGLRRPTVRPSVRQPACPRRPFPWTDSSQTCAFPARHPCRRRCGKRVPAR